MKKLLTTTICFLAMFGALTFNVSAQLSTCDFFPCGETIDGDTNPDRIFDSADDYFRFGVSLIFVGFISYGIFIIIKAALKIIRSEGNEEQVQEGAQAAKSVMIGVLMLLLGIIGLLIFSSALGAEGIFNTDIENPEGVDNIPIINN